MVALRPNRTVGGVGGTDRQDLQSRHVSVDIKIRVRSKSGGTYLCLAVLLSQKM